MARKNDKVILVTGATGKQGGAVLRRLRERGFSVRALTRDPDEPRARSLTGHGTEVMRGDLNDQASLTRALDGAYGVFSVQALERDVEEEIRQGVNLVDAAKRLRISHFIYSSVASADQDTGIPFFESKRRLEDHIRGSGLRYTIFRPAFFMENWLGMRSMIQEGHLDLPLKPDSRLQMIAVDDIGAFVALALEHPGRWQGHTTEIAGDELSMSALAGAFSRMLGREVQYNQVPWDAFQQQAGPDITRLWRFFEDQGTQIDISAVRQEHTGLIGFDHWLQTRWISAQAA